jgi:dinuclear metal center YbgI/SA1388 family protein
MEEWIRVGVLGVEGGRWDSSGGGGRGGVRWEEEMGFLLWGGVGYKVGMRVQELARECDRILETSKFRDYPGARNGLQVSHGRQVKKIGWAVDADMESIRRAGKEKVDFLIVHHGLFWGNSALDRKIRVRRIREAKRMRVAIYSSHLPLDAHPELGNSIGLLRALGLEKWKRKRFGKAMGREIGYRVEGVKIRISDLRFRIRDLRNNEGEKVRRWDGVKVIEAGPKVCRRIGIVTGGFGDLDQVVQAGLDTLITGEADYPTEVKAKELGINLILGGHRETEVFGARRLAHCLRNNKGERNADN